MKYLKIFLMVIFTGVMAAGAAAKPGQHHWHHHWHHHHNHPHHSH